MVHDYLERGLPGDPRAFAEQYYIHYPKVGIGQWPPVYYGSRPCGCSSSAWGRCHSSCSRRALRPSSPGSPTGSCETISVLSYAWIFGLLFCLLPLVQEFSGLVMTEMPLALFCLLAARAFGRFLERERHVTSLPSPPGLSWQS